MTSISASQKANSAPQRAHDIAPQRANSSPLRERDYSDYDDDQSTDTAADSDMEGQNYDSVSLRAGYDQDFDMSW